MALLLIPVEIVGVKDLPRVPRIDTDNRSSALLQVALSMLVPASPQAAHACKPSCGLWAPAPYPHIRKWKYDEWKSVVWRTSAPSAHEDLVQRAITREGRVDFALGPKPHIFSQKEALQCLAGQRILFSGDSYHMHTFIGLADILLGDPVNFELTSSGARRATLVRRMSQLQLLPATEGITWVKACHSDCSSAFDGNCSSCLLSNVATAPTLAVIVSGGVHWHGDKEALLRRSLLKLPGVLWATGPSYAPSLIPPMYLETMSKQTIPALVRLYRETTRPGGIAESTTTWSPAGVPVVDMFQVTRACVWANCSVDGGHRARFVNRMKAQLILNLLCRWVNLSISSTHT